MLAAQTTLKTHPSPNDPGLDADLWGLFAHSADLLCLVDRGGLVLHANPAWHELLGLSPEAPVGSCYLDVVVPEDRGEAQAAFAECVGRGENRSPRELRLRRRDGSVAWVKWAWHPGRDEDRYYAIIQDRSEAQTANAEFQAIMEAAPNGILTVSPSGEIVGANKQIETIFGYMRSELIGRNIEELVPERFRQGHANLRAGFMGTPSNRRMGAGRVLYARRRDGSEFPIEIGLSRALGPGGDFIYCSVVDVTEQKQQEEELRARVVELQRRRNETEMVSEMSSLLQHAAKESEALGILSWFGPRIFAGIPGGVYIRSSVGASLDLSASWNEFAFSDRLDPGDCWALRRVQVHLSLPGHPARCPHIAATSETQGESLCVPLSAHGHWLGMMTLLLEPGTSGERVEQLEALACTVGDQFGLALSNLQLRESLRNLSIRDPLTGLFNRRYLEETVTREFHRASRRQSQLSVLMVDVDHFKAFNDRYGHQIADDILRTVAATLATRTRTEDVACRYGGEEFVVLLPDANPRDAAARAEHLRGLIFSQSDENVSVSIGVASYPGDGKTWDQVLKAADSAMYKAKSRGRNRVVASDGTETASEDEQRSVPALAAMRQSRGQRVAGEC